MGQKLRESQSFEDRFAVNLNELGVDYSRNVESAGYANTEPPICQWESASTEWSTDDDFSVEFPARGRPSFIKILLGVLAGFLALTALVCAPRIFGIVVLAAAAIILPLGKIVIVLAIVALTSLGTPVFELPQVEVPVATVAVTELPMETEETIAHTEPPVVEVESILFGYASYSLGVGRSADIPFAVYPENATNVTLEYTVNNTEFAEVTLDSMDARSIHVTGIAPGDMVITLKAGQDVIAETEIHIVEIIPEEITIVPDKIAPVVGSAGAFTVAYDPEDVTNRNVNWESSDPGILRVNPDGTYEAVSIGTAIITATHTSGVAGTIEIEVTPVVVESITLTSNWDAELPFCKNKQMTLSAEILPLDAADKTIIWESSDESVATVSGKGVVTAQFAGSATITATSANGVQCHYEVVVEPSPQKFRVSASISMKSNNHVGNKWTTGFEFNGEAIRSGETVSIMPNEIFNVCGWAQDNDSKPDYGAYRERLTLTGEMCTSGFTIEGEADVIENGGRYSGNSAIWRVKIVFTPIN